jgi:hypothetical protein
MRACSLNAGLSRAKGSSAFALGNPKAWLGTAYHKVLEKIVGCDITQETLEAAVDRLWKQAIDDQEQRVRAHALNRRFGLPTTWPGYYIAYASVLLRAQELCGTRDSPTAPAAEKRAPPGTIREQEFIALGGKLLGKPDVVRPSEVIDYKSGAIFQYDDTSQAEVVKAAYIRQLRIYGYLVKEALGWWPQRGVLLPFAGAGVDIPLDPAECTREAEEAVELLDSYNAKARAGAELQKFASPSPRVCKWCSYKLLCSAFWRAASPDWSGQLDGAAIEGVLAEDPKVIHAGAARAIVIDIQAGSEVPRRAQIAPLSSAVHTLVPTLAAGEHVRVVGLRIRPDGFLAPTPRTVLVRVTDIPGIAVGDTSNRADS